MAEDETRRGVHGGSFCSVGDTHGLTTKGTPVVCTATPGDRRRRWRRTTPLPVASPDTITLPPPAAPDSIRIPGQDRLSRATTEQWDQIGRLDVPYDKRLAHIARMQNFDGDCQIGTRAEVDRAVAAGWTETWRGVFDGARTAADVNGDLREGPFQPGRGLYGNGVYTSTRKGTAETFRGRETIADYPLDGGPDFEEDDFTGRADPDSLLRIAIDPAARTVDYDTLRAEQAVWFDTNGSRIAGTRAESVLRDPGRFAAAAGYDVIRVVDQPDGGDYPGVQTIGDDEGVVPGQVHADQYVVLNRTVMMIQTVEDPA